MTVALTATAQASLSWLLQKSYLCGQPRLRAQPGTTKEWLHFTVHGGELDLVVNFSLSSAACAPGASPQAVVARTGCLVRHSRWEGDIDTCRPELTRVGRGETHLRLGPNAVRFRDGGFDVSVNLERTPISVQLRLEPSTMPAQINNFVVDGVPALNWLVIPRLRAWGRVSVGSRQFTLENAAAYHDRNWGAFRWGGNFSWEWGYAQAAGDSSPFSLVLARLSDRGRFNDLMRGLFLWRHQHQHRVFSGDELRITHEGLFRAQRPLKVPAVMGLLHQGSASDVPRRYVVRAQRGADRLNVVFETVDVAQVIVPNDGDFGVTIINECRGDVTVEGRVGGEPVAFGGPTIFEFLSG
jgi:hypothetical protein